MLMLDVEINLEEKLKKKKELKEALQQQGINNLFPKSMTLLMLLAMKLPTSPKPNGEPTSKLLLKKLNKLFTKIKVRLRLKNSKMEANYLLNSF